MTTATLALPDTQQIDSEASEYLKLVSAAVITTPETYEWATECLKELKAIQKKIDESFDPIIKANFQAHKTACAQKKVHSEPLERAEALLKQKAGRYLQHEEQKRIEAQRAAQEEANRIAREQQAEAEKKAKAERAARAAELKRQGDLEAAKAEKAKPIVVEPVQVAAIVPQAAPAKVQGTSSKTVWKFEVTDASQLPREYTQPDIQKIGSVVKAMGGETRIPGCRVWSEKQVSVR